MSEVSGENGSKESSNGDFTITHGALQINFPAVDDPYVKKGTPYHCKNLISGKETNLSPSELALIMSIDTNKFKKREEICTDFKDRLAISYKELKIKRKISELSHSNFGFIMHNLQTKLGYGFIIYNAGGYVMAEYPVKKETKL
jgi:hypothetical protein